MRGAQATADSGSTARPRPPVIVTFDRHDELLDIVGDLDWFAGDHQHREAVLDQLRDLHSGGGGRIPAVELSASRYADLQLLEEEEAWHCVLRDVSDMMQSLQHKQQLGHELELRERQQRKSLGRGDALPARAQGLQPFRRGAELFAGLAEDLRAPLALLSGHARLLETRLAGDAAALRSLAAIQQAAVRLEALANNAVTGFGRLEAHAPGQLELSQLAAGLQHDFSLQARAQGVDLRIRLPADAAPVQVDVLSLRQVLTNLLAHALDGLSSGALNVDLIPAATHLDIEIGGEPQGFEATRFGPLLTSTDLFRQGEPGGSFALAVSQQLLQRLEAQVELVARTAGGFELWMRIPTTPVPGNATRQPPDPAATAGRPTIARGGRIAAVAVPAAEEAATLVSLLASLGVPAVAVADRARIEALRRDGSLALLVIGPDFDADARALALRLAGDGDAAVLLLEDADDGGGQQHGLLASVPRQGGRDVLARAITRLLDTLRRGDD